MRVSKVDTGVILEEGELRDDGEEAEMQTDAPSSDSSVAAQQKAMKSLFGDDDKEICEESEIIPTLEPLPPNEVGKSPLLHQMIVTALGFESRIQRPLICLSLRVRDFVVVRAMFITVASEKILAFKKIKDLFKFVDCFNVAVYYSLSFSLNKEIPVFSS